MKETPTDFYKHKPVKMEFEGTECRKAGYDNLKNEIKNHSQNL